MSFKKQLRKTLISLVVEEAVEFLLRRLPFLNWGPLGWLTEKIVRKVVEALYAQGRLQINKVISRYHIHKETGALKDARTRAIQARKDGGKDAIKDADKQIKAAARDLIRFGRTPL